MHFATDNFSFMGEFLTVTGLPKVEYYGTISADRSFIAAHDRAIPLLLLAAPPTSPTYIDQFYSLDLVAEAE